MYTVFSPSIDPEKFFDEIRKEFQQFVVLNVFDHHVSPIK